MMRFFEDIRVGDKVTIGSHVFLAEEIMTFARQYDPQPFHIDEKLGETSHFGALVASGWHTAALWMRKTVDYRKREADAMRRRGEPVPVIGPSPGFKDMRWLKPVFAGDTIAYTTEAIETRVSKTRPEWGLVRLLNSGTNQRGVQVISFIGTAFIERRDKTPL
jgi:acyl dehydratase